MMDNKLEKLKKEYMNVPIPVELDYAVRKALKESGVNSMRYNNNFKRIRIAAASIAAVFIVLTVAANTSPVFAAALSKVPVVGSIVKVLTFREYTINEDTFNTNIKVPAIQGLENKTLENSLNEKYLAENKKLYEQFVTDMEDLKQNGGGHLGVNSGYEVKTDTERILSIGRYVVNTVGSSSTTMKYDTIDKKNEILITLPSLFKDDRYVDIIYENIKKQMIEQNKVDSNKFYWVAGIEQKGTMKLFEKISKEQSFYIDSEGKLIISFDKYEVAPGYMGIVQFVIPTNIISDILVSNEYIKEEKNISKDNEEMDYEIIKKISENNNSNTKIFYPQISGYAGQLLMDYMNQSLERIDDIYGKGEMYQDVSIDYIITKMDRDIISVLFKGIGKISGGREINIQQSVNLDIKTSNAIEFDNLIKADQTSEAAVRLMLDQKAKTMGLKYGVESERARLYFEGENVVFFYMPADDSATSFAEISVPMEELEGFLNTDFGERPAS
ncbi:MAG: DUF3298 domain-containing protein [Lutisporaceae bacterium]